MSNEYFIIVNGEAKIFESMPEVRESVIDPHVLSPFPHIIEYAKQKIAKIQLDSLQLHQNHGIEICYIHKGRYEWVVEDEVYTLFPGDVFITCPWENHGSRGGFLDLGILSWIIIAPETFDHHLDFHLGSWSRIDKKEQQQIGEILKNKHTHAFRSKYIASIFDELFEEITNSSIGSVSRVNNLIEDLFIQIARGLQNSKPVIDKYKIDISILEKLLLSDLNRAWTVEEMASHMNMGLTNFIEKCKYKTGLTPINFLIELRILNAIKLIKGTNKLFTDIAYECGFSSIQHFSDTFKKKIGLSPSQYKKKLIQEKLRD